MAEINCPQCRRPIPADIANSGRVVPCRGCNRELMLDLFPAAQRSLHTPSGVLTEGAASCFFHDEKPAQAACDGCGRFVCALCDVPFGEQHLCPECVQARSREGRQQTIVNSRIAWDRLALLVAIVPLLLVGVGWFFTILTAPLVLFLIIRFWRAPNSLVASSKPRFVIAGLIAVATLAIWIMVIVEIASS